MASLMKSLSIQRIVLLYFFILYLDLFLIQGLRDLVCPLLNGQEPEDHGVGQPDWSNLRLGHGRGRAQPHQAHPALTSKGWSYCSKLLMKER